MSENFINKSRSSNYKDGGKRGLLTVREVEKEITKPFITSLQTEGWFMEQDRTKVLYQYAVPDYHATQ